MCHLFKSQRLLVALIAIVFASVLFFNTGPTALSAQDQRPLLGVQFANVNATQNVTQNATLPSGFVLSGNLRSTDGIPVFFGTVIARMGNVAYTGPVMFTGFASTYRVVLPAGTYQLSVRRPIIGDDPDNFLFVATDIPGMVTVSANRMMDLLVPAAPMGFPVMGNVTSQGTLPTKGNLGFRSTDGKVETFAEFDRTYQTNLPAGMYDVVATLEITHPGGLKQFLLVRLGRITVNGALTANLVLPTVVTLSGVVKKADGSPATEADVFAVDTRDLPPAGGGNAPPCTGDAATVTPITEGFVTVPENSTTGAYRLSLPAAMYGVFVNVDLDPSDQVFAALGFPLQLSQINLTANQTRDFMVPPVPGFVTVSGIVRDGQGQPVAGASVSATTAMITGTPNATFSTATQTDAGGRYEMRVLNGTGYTITICPPVPGGPGFSPSSPDRSRPRVKLPASLASDCLNF
jgi:hypothetical protein